MKVIKNEIRPVGFITLELTENEVQAIVSVFEENCYIRNRPFEEILGTRGDVYKVLTEALKTKP